MKKIFVSALAVLNLLFASAQEEKMDVSAANAGGNVEVTTKVEEQTQAKTNEAQPTQSVAAQTSVSQTVTTTKQNIQQSSSSSASSSSSSDDYDSDFFSSHNESSSNSGEFRNSIGIRFGYTSSKVASLGVYSASVPGITIGAVDQIWFGETNVFTEVGLFFTQKGYSLKYFEPSKTKINYIEVPAMVCHRMGRETLSVTAKAGGYLACGIKGTLKTQVSDNPDAIDLFKEENEFDLFKEGALSRFDAGVRFGLAFVVRKVMVGCRYDLGLYKIDKKDLIYGEDELMLGYKHLQNRSFQILMGINFN